MLSIAEYIDAKNRSARNAALWAGRRSVSVEEIATWPQDAQITNEERSAIERFEFCAAPPESYFLYVDAKRNRATTWAGEPLGAVSFRGREYRAGQSTRRSIVVRGINGRTYRGTYYVSSGDYARVRLVKNDGEQWTSCDAYMRESGWMN